jgi:hypothetical protein
MTALAYSLTPQDYALTSNAEPLKDVERLAQEIEGYFLTTGEQLEKAAHALDTLNAQFDDLAQAIEHVATGTANQTLETLARTLRAEHHTTSAKFTAILEILKTMTGCVSTTQQSVSNIEKSTRIIIALVVNARIASVNLGAAEDDFKNFAAEIRRSIDVSNNNLEDLSDELTLVLRYLHTAFDTQAQVFQRWDSIAQAVPDRLTYNLAQVADRREQLTRAAFAVGQTAQRLGKNIGIAVVALQSADSVRQRMEHVVNALQLKSDDKAELSALYQLQAAQLADMAELLEAQVQDLGQALEELAQDAKTVAEAGLGSLRLSSSRTGSSFLSNIARDVQHIDIVLRDLANAEAQAQDNIAQVVVSAKRLERSIKVVQSFDVNMRVMALNANLKASRLGDKGRALTSIAVSLRQCSKSTALDANQAMQLIEQLTKLANDRQALRLNEETKNALSAHTPDQISTTTQELQNASTHVDTLLETLSSYSADVAKLILESHAQMARQSDTVKHLHAAAASLRAQALVCHPAPMNIAAYAQEPSILACQRLYTMRQERVVHAQLFGQKIADNAEVAASPKSIDDFLF